MQAEVVPLRFPSLPEKCKVKQQPADLPYNLLIITFSLEAEKLQLLFFLSSSFNNSNYSVYTIHQVLFVMQCCCICGRCY